MYYNDNLNARLNFQKNTNLSDNERLTFLFSHQNNLPATSPTTLNWPKLLSSTDR